MASENPLHRLAKNCLDAGFKPRRMLSYLQLSKEDMDALIADAKELPEAAEGENSFMELRQEIKQRFGRE